MFRRTISLMLAVDLMAAASAVDVEKFHLWALTPPMGWNSWDNFGTTINEVQAKARVLH